MIQTENGEIMVGNKNINMAEYGGVTREEFMRESACGKCSSVFELIKSKEPVSQTISKKETARMLLESRVPTA